MNKTNKTKKQPTTRTLSIKLRRLAKQMRNAAGWMEYIGGFDDRTTAKAMQLLGAARMVDTWADGMENKEGGR